MHAYSLVSPGVGWCATNEVVQFIVCCATFFLPVGLLFSQRGVGFSQAMSLSTPGEKFEFLIVTFKVKSLNPRVLAHVSVSVWVSGGQSVRVYGCVGDWVFFFLFILVRLSQ